MQMMIPPSDIRVGDNVRKGETKASPSLIASIKEHGIIEPLATVWEEDDQVWLLVAGHRRLDAAIELGLLEVPIFEVRPENAADVIGIQVAENMFREDLTMWELSQAAWDLKSEGLNQKAVANKMSLPKKAVSRMQQIAKTINQDPNIDDSLLNLFDLETLELLAEPDKRFEVPVSDVLRLLEGENNPEFRTVDDAKRQAATEIRDALFYNELADTLTMLAEKNVSILEKDPRYKLSSNGSHIKNKKVANIGKEPQGSWANDNWIDVPLDTHVLEPCHAVWVDPGSEWHEPKLIHLCTDLSRHELKGKSKVKTVDASQKAERKIKNSQEREARKQETELRYRKARAWVTKLSASRANEIAFDLALGTIYEDDYRTFGRILGYDQERPRKADPSWWKKRFVVWCQESKCSKETNPKKHQRLVVGLLAAAPYVTEGWMRSGDIDTEIGEVDV